MFLPLQMFHECIYNIQNSISKQYQHNITMSKQAEYKHRGGDKIIIQQNKIKAYSPYSFKITTPYWYIPTL